MKRISDFFITVAGIALFGMLALGLIALFQSVSSNDNPLSQVPGYPPPQGTAPIPGPTLPPQPTPVVTIIWSYTPTPWLTFTPPPQPTRQPGPTETPLPLPEPAKDAAGFITFVTTSQVDAWGGGNTLALYSFSVDKVGLLEGAPLRLTGDAELKLQWGPIHPSPDGTRLAIEGAWGGVTILNAETGQIEPLARLGSGGAGGFLAWHPDSRQILYRGDGDYDAGLWLVGDKQYTALYVDPSGVSAIRDGAVSPDGQKVIYSFWRGFGGLAELRMMNSDGSDARILYTAESDIYLLSWSPDGSKIAFVGDKGYTVMDTDGANPRPLPVQDMLGGYSFEPVWSPDSRLIAYVASDGTSDQKGQPFDPFRGTSIHLVDVVTGEAHPLLADGSTSHIDPTWSPDGTQIAFASTQSGILEIWSVNVDGTNLRQITNVGQFVRFPVWRGVLKSQ